MNSELEAVLTMLLESNAEFTRAASRLEREARRSARMLRSLGRRLAVIEWTVRRIERRTIEN